ncbi:hypothetical protein [Actinomadura flavalba]|uniref:hypothetical protein n=1 Tax=Actinomadura flavalba TaxID=1120938 RepID=UPI000381D178|nr:hypothetical protein [Actinomadura flavalba]
MNTMPTASETLAEIQRVQCAGYAGQRLPRWYAPGLIGLVTLAGVATEVHGAVRAALWLVAAGWLAVFAGALWSRTRVKWRSRPWTPRATARMGLWVLSLLVVCGVVPPVVYQFTGSHIWPRVVTGVVVAVYAAATMRWAERRAHSALEEPVTR